MLASATYFTAKALVGAVGSRDVPLAARVRPEPADDQHAPARTHGSSPTTWRRIRAAVTRSRNGVPDRTGRGHGGLGHSVPTD